MKKISYILISIAAAVFVMSCAKDEGFVRKKSPKISIALKSDVPATVYPGENVDFVFSMKYAKGIKSAYATADDVELEGTRMEFEDAPDSTGLEFSYVAKDIYAGNSVDIAVVAEAVDGADGHYDFPIFVLASKSKIEVKLPEDAPEMFEVDGSTLSFDITITSANVDMKSLSTYKGETPIPEMTYEIKGDLRKHTLKFAYTPTLGDTGAPTVFSFEIMDVNGNIINEFYSVQFYKAASKELNEYSGITMGLNKCPSFDQFFNAVDNIVYPAAGVSAVCSSIDIATFWSNNAGTQGAAFAAPVAQNITSIYPEATIVTTLGGTTADIPVNWKIRNETTFREVDLTADEYAAINTVAELQEYYDNGVKPANDHVTFVMKAAGKVRIFITHRCAVDAGTGEILKDNEGNKIYDIEKIGALRVTKPASGNTGTITFDYKIEK